jgi:DNA polymerase-3 subunit beta
MKITCDRELLLAAFQTAASVAPARSPKAILTNVKLEATEKGAILMATDLDIGVRIEATGVEAEGVGAAVLSVDRFGSILRESSDEALRIDVGPEGVIVRGQRSQFRLPSQDPHEFPRIDDFAEEKYYEVSARLLKEIIRRTLFAADAESSRYALGGVMLEFENDKIIGVATDGRRLARMEGPAKAHGGGKSGDAMTIVPMRSMQLIERALGDGEGEVQIAARQNDVLIRGPRTVIYSRLVEGRFPRWRDVFPTRRDASKIDLLVGPFYSAVRQAAIVASEESRGIDFHFADGTLVLSGETADIGESRVEMPIAYDGKPTTLSLDHRFVADFLKVLDPAKSITLEIEDADAAALFQTDDGYAYIVMPLTRDRRRASGGASGGKSGEGDS